jgi:uncharacterized protein
MEDIYIYGGTKSKSSKTASSISLLPEGFKRQNAIKGGLQKTFGNLTPV